VLNWIVLWLRTGALDFVFLQDIEMHTKNKKEETMTISFLFLFYSLKKVEALD